MKEQTPNSQVYYIQGFPSEEKSRNPKNIPHSLVYKPVHQKVRSVPAIYPEDARVIRRFPEDPLLSLPPIPTHPPDFIPTKHLTQERLDILKINGEGFLWPEEEKLFKAIFKNNEKVLAFENSERGTLSREYFSDYIIPTIEHVPWAEKVIPIPPGLVEGAIKTLKEKIAAGVYEPSQASYRSPMFFVKKKDGSPRQVIDLRPLNAVTIKDAGLPPVIDSFVEPFAGASVYSSFDLLWGYDARILHPKSRDLTSFQTPLGLLRYCALPMGYTNAVPEFQNCIVFILQDEIPHNCTVMIDDIGIKGPPSRYIKDGEFETIPENPKIRRFIWEHAEVVNRVLHRLKHAGATISPKKSQVARPSIVLAGQKLTYEGRLPDTSRVSKILKWPSCKTVTQVRGFLGLCGTLRIWIKGYSELARPLTELVRKDAEFIWDSRRQQAMDKLKEQVANSPALVAIDYSSDLPVILAVDTSNIAIGFVLYQMDEQNRRRPVRFGSLPINERESRYSQAKLELYGLFRALRQTRFHTAGVKNLIVEVDASYIKQMINHPDLQPNATLNRWIASILLFHFTLVHVPAERHKAADALSRRERADADSDGEYDSSDEEDWVTRNFHLSKRTHYFVEPHSKTLREGWATVNTIQKPRISEELIFQIFDYLSNLKLPTFSRPSEQASFLNKAQYYYLEDGKMWKRTPTRPVQVILDKDQRQFILKQAHDLLGHRGVYSTAKTVSTRFWWPTFMEDIKEYIRTCHQCQIRSTFKFHIPPTISIPTTVFSKVYLDIMLMPKAQGYRYIVAARDDLSGAAEGRKLKKASARTVSQFIFEELICRYGNIVQIVTDNGPEVKGATEELNRRYGISQIHISPYNSQANGVVERGHYTIREAIVKTCEGDINKWPDFVHHAFFADRITVRRATGYSPYYLLYGTDPILPLDLFEATFLVSGFKKDMTTSDLLSLRIRQIAKQEKDVLQAARSLEKSRLRNAQQFVQRFANRMQTKSFPEGSLVLIRNSRVEQELDRKTKPRYLGPYQVVRRTAGGSYVLKELDGSFVRRAVAAFRVIPYYARKTILSSLQPSKYLHEDDDSLQSQSDEEDDEHVQSQD